MPILTFFTDQAGYCDGDSLVFLTQEDECDQVIIPEPEELEIAKRCQGRNREGQDHFSENGEVGSTIDIGRYPEQLARNSTDVLKQVGSQWQAKT